MKESIKARYKQTLITTIEKHLPQAKIYLYGSRARKTHQEGADVDIAIDNGKQIDDRLISLIKEELEESTMPLLVDIIDTHSVDDRFLSAIKKDWVVWKKE
jgi:predicted nucleotidyltransferase